MARKRVVGGGTLGLPSLNALDELVHFFDVFDLLAEGKGRELAHLAEAEAIEGGEGPVDVLRSHEGLRGVVAAQQYRQGPGVARPLASA
jgi:hypothetical protein